MWVIMKELLRSLNEWYGNLEVTIHVEWLLVTPDAREGLENITKGRIQTLIKKKD